MGMFDSVWVRCPKCDNNMEFQSKAGVCEMREYCEGDAVPMVVASDVLEDVRRCECGENIKPVLFFPAVQFYLMKGVISNELDD